MSASRAYHSPRRQAQADRTRELIVEALIDQVCDSGRCDFSIAELAARAGVAVRTVYRYFPTREDLFAAIDARVTFDQQPADPHDWSEPRALERHVEHLFGWFEEHARLVEASHLTQLGREVRGRGRKRRAEALRRELDQHLAFLPERERRRVHAVMFAMFGSQTWRTMHDELGLPNEEVIDAVRWVIRLLMDDLERRAGAAEETADA